MGGTFDCDPKDVGSSPGRELATIYVCHKPVVIYVIKEPVALLRSSETNYIQIRSKKRCRYLHRAAVRFMNLYLSSTPPLISVKATEVYIKH